MNITIKASVSPTEDPDRVRQAVLNLFPDAVGEVSQEGLRMAARDHATFARRVSEQRIRDAAVSVLARSARRGDVRFGLNRQAALMGKINFSEGWSPMGDIVVTVDADDKDAAILALTGGPTK